MINGSQYLQRTSQSCKNSVLPNITRTTLVSSNSVDAILQQSACNQREIEIRKRQLSMQYVPTADTLVRVLKPSPECLLNHTASSSLRHTRGSAYGRHRFANNRLSLIFIMLCFTHLQCTRYVLALVVG